MPTGGFIKASAGMELEQLDRQYKALLNKAETLRRDRGIPTKQEAECYLEAQRVCLEIRDKSRTRPNIYRQWEIRAAECRDKAEEIVELLNPSYKEQKDALNRQMEEQALQRALDAKRAQAEEAARMAAQQARPLRNGFGDLPENTYRAPVVTPTLPQPGQVLPQPGQVFQNAPAAQTVVAPPPAPTPAPAPVQRKNSDGMPANGVPISDGRQIAEDGRAATFSPSGFQTFNAIPKTITAETIEKWYKPAPTHDFSSVTGMEEQKALLAKAISDLQYQLTNHVIGYEREQCLFFYGPPGTGKTFLIEAFIAELVKKHGYYYMKLEGGDIHAGLVGVAEKTIQVLFAEAMDHAPCVIFIDEFDGVCKSRDDTNVSNSSKDLTVAFLQAYNKMIDSDKEIILIGATNYPDKIDAAMMDRLTAVLVPLPDEEARKQFFEQKFKDIKLDGITPEEMGEMTDNYSYRDLRKLTKNLKSTFRDQAIGRNTVLDAVGQIVVEKSDEQTSSAITQGTEKLSREMFLASEQAYIPSEKSRALKALEDFEDRLKRAQEGS